MRVGNDGLAWRCGRANSKIDVMASSGVPMGSVRQISYFLQHLPGAHAGFWGSVLPLSSLASTTSCCHARCVVEQVVGKCRVRISVTLGSATFGCSSIQSERLQKFLCLADRLWSLGVCAVPRVWRDRHQAQCIKHGIRRGPQ